MQLLMEDEQFLDIDPDKAAIRFPPGQRIKKFGKEGTEEYKINLQSYRNWTIQSLVTITRRFIVSLQENLHCFPPSVSWLVRQIFCLLKKSAIIQEKEMFAITTDLVLTHFICPAIVNPEPYGITDAPISYIARFNLIQVAQILQMLAMRRYEGVDPKVEDLYSQFDKNSVSSLLDTMLEGNTLSEEPSIAEEVRHQGLTRSAGLLTKAELNNLNSVSSLLDTMLEGNTLSEEPSIAEEVRHQGLTRSAALLTKAELNNLNSVSSLLDTMGNTLSGTSIAEEVRHQGLTRSAALTKAELNNLNSVSSLLDTMLEGNTLSEEPSIAEEVRHQGQTRSAGLLTKAELNNLNSVSSLLDTMLEGNTLSEEPSIAEEVRHQGLTRSAALLTKAELNNLNSVSSLLDTMLEGNTLSEEPSIAEEVRHQGQTRSAGLLTKAELNNLNSVSSLLDTMLEGNTLSEEPSIAEEVRHQGLTRSAALLTKAELHNLVSFLQTVANDQSEFSDKSHQKELSGMMSDLPPQAVNGHTKTVKRQPSSSKGAGEMNNSSSMSRPVGSGYMAQHGGRCTTPIWHNI
ncbi:GTPase-activating protein and VPS9 domain-containing protein 1 [Homalodisca vitripennis]|nr:GTPase-activating protein and VPS9 domain-containing protein 1 [Homalodisca vitripennis]